MAVAFGLALLSLAVNMIAIQATSPFHCLHCHEEHSLEHCHRNDTCSFGQKCFVRQVEMGGTLQYYAGCGSEDFCDGNIHTSINDRGVKTLCHKCCPNYGWCKVSDLCPETKCKLCNGEGSLEDCNGFETCGLQETCFVRQEEIHGRLEYFAGCSIDHLCIGTNYISKNGHGGKTLCHKCCPNDHSCSLSALCPAPQASRKCQVCSGQGCKGHVGLTECGDPSDLCMTSVENREDGTQTYSKRCATVNECDDQWLKETTLKPECISFHPDSTYKFNFNCTYCCKTDGCNRDNIPDVDSMYLVG